MNDKPAKLDVILIALAAAAVLLMDAHVNELHGTAVFYASLIREMVTNGWMSIFEGERAYFLKPPLVLCLSAASAELFGLNNFSVSLFPRLAGVLCAALTYLIAKNLSNHRTAALATIVLITNSTFIQFSATLRMDSMLLFGGLLSVYGWLRRDCTWSSPVIFLGITIGVLSKGPLGFAPVLLIGLHALIFGIAVTREIRWRWAVLLIPIVAWYGLLFMLHGLSPFSQLGADLTKPAADLATSPWDGTLSEYVVKPARRYLPFLPFMIVGAVMAVLTAMRGKYPHKQYALWLLLWFTIVFIAAAAKPDKDIRYLYMGLPVLALFAANALAYIQERFRLVWLPSSLAVLILVLVGIYNYGPGAKPDTRPIIETLNKELSKRTRPVDRHRRLSRAARSSKETEYSSRLDILLFGERTTSTALVATISR